MIARPARTLATIAASGIAAAVLVVVIAAASVGVRAVDGPDDAVRTRGIAAADAAMRALEAVEASSASVEQDIALVRELARQVLELRIRWLGIGRVQAHREHLDRMQRLHEKTRRRVEAGIAQQRDALLTAFWLAEAELLLAEAEAGGGK